MRTETFYFTEDQSVSLTTYLLDSSEWLKGAEIRPAVLIIPGGGYHVLSEREAEPIAMAYLAEGFQAFVLRYSLKEKAAFPTPLLEAEWALSMIRENSKEWDVDANKIATIGFSAGGHLAAALSTIGSIRPNATILAYPCILDSIGDVLAVPVPSLEKEVDLETPPAFIFATCEDELVPVENSLEFARALNHLKIPFEMHIFQKGMHGLSLAKPFAANKSARNVDANFAQWHAMSVNWLHGLFGDFEVE